MFLDSQKNIFNDDFSPRFHPCAEREKKVARVGTTTPSELDIFLRDMKASHGLEKIAGNGSLSCVSNYGRTQKFFLEEHNITKISHLKGKIESDIESGELAQNANGYIRIANILRHSKETSGPALGILQAVFPAVNAEIVKSNILRECGKIMWSRGRHGLSKDLTKMAFDLSPTATNTIAYARNLSEGDVQDNVKSVNVLRSIMQTENKCKNILYNTHFISGKSYRNIAYHVKKDEAIIKKIGRELEGAPSSEKEIRGKAIFHLEAAEKALGPAPIRDKAKKFRDLGAALMSTYLAEATVAGRQQKVCSSEETRFTLEESLEGLNKALKCGYQCFSEWGSRELEKLTKVYSCKLQQSTRLADAYGQADNEKGSVKSIDFRYREYKHLKSAVDTWKEMKEKGIFTSKWDLASFKKAKERLEKKRKIA